MDVRINSTLSPRPHKEDSISTVHRWVATEMASYMGQYTEELTATARLMSTPGKGILVADESPDKMEQLFDRIDVDNTLANRNAFRQLLFTTTSANKYISAAILSEETLYQRTSTGKMFPHVLRDSGIVPGVKLDTGTAQIPATGGETATEGLDRLAERCQTHYVAGARFGRWESLFNVDPSPLAVRHNADCVARYAIVCQSNGLVPIIEPRVVADGSHDIKKCAATTETVLAAVFKSLNNHRVLLEATVLCLHMVTPGADGPRSCSEDIAGYTLQSLQRTVPVAVPGVAFVSGHQSEEDATVNLNAISKMGAVKPWSLCFAYGPPLHQSAFDAWAGETDNVGRAQVLFLVRCQATSQASLGKYVHG